MKKMNIKITLSLPWYFGATLKYIFKALPYMERR
jgi:hypothetical protein